MSESVTERIQPVNISSYAFWHLRNRFSEAEFRHQRKLFDYVMIEQPKLLGLPELNSRFLAAEEVMAEREIQMLVDQRVSGDDLRQDHFSAHMLDDRCARVALVGQDVRIVELDRGGDFLDLPEYFQLVCGQPVGRLARFLRQRRVLRRSILECLSERWDLQRSCTTKSSIVISFAPAFSFVSIEH